jgi:tripartite-type tricarboxylate transporter receptor subunit TctC
MMPQVIGCAPGKRAGSAPRRRRKLAGKTSALGAVALACAVSSIASAQTYPVRPVRMIVGFAAGGATDIAARALAQKLSETIGQQVIVDNRPGAASMVAAEAVARGAPDGYTMLFANATIAMPSLFAKLAFDPQRDLRPVTLVGYGPLALTVHPSLPVTSVNALVALAKKRPGDLNFASAGAGSFTHLAMELFITLTDTKLLHVPYKGGGPSVIATMAGETQLTFASVGASIPPVKQGRLRALAVSGLKRSLALPDVPSVSEAGVKGYDATSWYGMLAPSATPPAVITRIGQEAMKALADAQLRERLLAQGIEPATGGVEEFAGYFDAEVVKWAKVIKDAAIPPQ